MATLAREPEWWEITRQVQAVIEAMTRLLHQVGIYPQPGEVVQAFNRHTDTRDRVVICVGDEVTVESVPELRETR